MSTTEKRSVTITLDGTNKKSVIPLKSGTAGADVFDIRKIYNDLGLFTFDPGYGATASCESKITYIDGDVGVLLYRGYPIEQLAQQCDFLETCYLLLKGDLPNTTQKADSAPTTPTIVAIGCASRRKPVKKRLICSCTMVWCVTVPTNSFFCAASGSSLFSSR